ncbi:hypothetical protein HZB60_09795 [candidate division KSB1 bacterium]|nr:hypothetical protein [candidate division KSB1 bacterium]
MKSLRLNAVFIFLLLSAVARNGSAAILYVDDSAVGADDGTSWTNALTDLRIALAAAVAGDEVRVAQGSYFSSPPGGARDSTFALKNGVALRGGYQGTGVNPDARDWQLYPTVLSGDISRDDSSNWYYHSDNSYHVVSAIGNDSTAILEGFVVRDGYYGGNFWQGVGGGLFVDGGNPTVQRCRFEYNLSGYGGGMFGNNATLLLDECEFVGNYAWSSGRGGGFADYGTCVAHFERCEFTNNWAEGMFTEGVGGAIYNEMDCLLSINDCLFQGNRATNSPYSSGIYPALGGAVFSFASPVRITDSRFLGNHSHNGGGVFSFGRLEVYNSVFSANGVTEWARPGYPGAGGMGGGLCVGAFFADTSKVVNCVFQNNTAHNTGGVYLGYETYNNQFGLISNCILWGNSDVNGAYGKAQYGGVKPEYSCVQNLFLAPPDDDPPAPEDVPGSVDTNPQFVDANGADNVFGTPDDDVHLLATSPCIDAGDNGILPAFLLTDPDGFARKYDDPNTPDTGGGTAPLVDMGVYEYHLAAAPGMPTGLVIRVAGLDAVLRWTAAAGATSYRVYRDVVPEVSVDLAHQIGTSLTTTFTDAAVFVTAAGRQYYAVTASAP